MAMNIARGLLLTLVASAALAGCGGSATSSSLPTKVGDCARTTVATTGPRLEGTPDSGSSIHYANGLSQVDYSVVPGIANSRPGDEVSVCLVSIPTDCPPGDTRGRVYVATNLRTRETWRAPDSQHMCGGA
jgi:hypothetical protein